VSSLWPLESIRTLKWLSHQEESHERIISVPDMRKLVMAPPQSPASTGDAGGPQALPLVSMIYGSVSLGRRWSWRSASQQGFPLDVQIKGCRRHHLFSRMCLDFCLSGESHRYTCKMHCDTKDMKTVERKRQWVHWVS
jgi:hypothetical protein